jgi:hypothetical protein
MNATPNSRDQLLAVVLAQPDFPKGRYARSVAEGRALLSGADLKADAKRWGVWYYKQRAIVKKIWLRCGGIVQVGDHGKLSLEAKRQEEKVHGL